MVVEDPHYVIRRCESRLYAFNESCHAEYLKVLKLVTFYYIHSML